MPASHRPPTTPRPPRDGYLSPLADPHALLGGGLAGPELLVRLDVLRRDVAAILAGSGPSERDLARAPMLHAWATASRPTPCLVGHADGHPRLLDGPIVTSELWALSVECGWARTLSRWYCLGESRDPGP